MPPASPQTKYTLLHALTTHALFLLHYIPPNTSTESSPTHNLLELAKAVISSWAKWVEALSSEVNARGGMYPHSQVTTWAEGLDGLFATRKAGSTLSGIGLGFGTQTAWGQQNLMFGQDVSRKSGEEEHALVVSFKEALAPVRQKFTHELGWVIGRRV